MLPTNTNLAGGQAIPVELSFCMPKPVYPLHLSKNFNPQPSLNDIPPGTKSFALICHDSDVSINENDVNQERPTIPPSLSRVDFFHWVLMDLPAAAHCMNSEKSSQKITPCCLPLSQTLDGARQGINNHSECLAGDTDMRKNYHGHNDPGPPRNDEIVYRYVFMLYALDIERAPLEEPFVGKEVRDEIKGYVLSKASLTDTYTLNSQKDHI